MKQLNNFRPFLFFLFPLILCLLWGLWGTPLNAKESHFQQMINLEFIEGVNPVKDFDFNYLHQTPPPVEIALIDNVRLADRKAAQLPENGLIGIPLGSSGPIPVKRELPALKFTLREPGRYWAVGSADQRDGTPSPLSVADVRQMFAIEKRIGGFGGISQDKEGEQRVADASGTFLEARRPIVHNILILDTETEELFVEEDVLMSTICRETVNSFLNDSYHYYRRRR